MTTAFDAKKVKTGICRFKSKCHRPSVSTVSRRLDVSSAVRSRHATPTALFSPRPIPAIHPPRLILRPFLPRVSNTFLLSFLSLRPRDASGRSFARSRCWENRPTVLPTSLFSSFFLFSFLFSPRRRCHYRALAATFTRSLNRANNKRLFRLYSVLVNRTSMWNNRTIICSGCDTPRSFLPRDRVPRVQQLRYPILDYE